VKPFKEGFQRLKEQEVNMSKFTVSAMALLATLSLPATAIGQTNNDEQVVQPTQENQEQMVQSAEKKDSTKAPDGMILLQDENTFLTSDLIGATVYNPKDEAIGDVNDVLVMRDGKVEGVIIGAGGFLGIGEKDVAIELSKLKMVETESGIKLVLDTSKDELAAAPEFKSKSDMQAETEANEPGSTQGLMVPEQEQKPVQTEQTQPQQ
jgi:hypothetical protein